MTIVAPAGDLTRPTYVQLIRAQVLMDRHRDHIQQHEQYAHRCLACDLWTVLNEHTRATA